MADFTRYRIYCETEVAWIETYSDSEPTVCPHNPSHTVRTGSAAQLDSKRIVLVPDVDGQGIIGGDTGYGNELLRVLGAGRFEKINSEAEPVLYIGGSSSHPTGYSVLSLDQDNNGPVLDLDSEATSYPLVNLQPLSSNTRGDICFGTDRGADPSSPGEADIWYQSTDEEFKFRKSASTVYFRDAIKLQTYDIAPTVPTDNYVLSWNNGGSQWEPVDISSLGGSYSNIASSTTSTTTTSQTDVPMAGMTLTPAAGTYISSFTTTFRHSNNGSVIYTSLYAGGAKQEYSEVEVQSPRWVNAGYTVVSQARVTVNGAQAIEVYWRTTGGTATASNRSLIIERVS